jgi:KaiC/GvpD/RAD55 family RecA-like ATPase
MNEKISTGMGPVDRQLSGGIRPGSLLAITAGPNTQSESLLHQLIGTRPTLYLTTLRRVEAVESGLPDSVTDNVYVQSVSQEQSMDSEFLREVTGSGSYNPTFSSADSIVDSVYEIVSNIDRDINVIVDPMNPLEETGNSEVYREVLNEIKSTMLETGSLGVLHCITMDGPPVLRDITLTISDMVWELELTASKDELEYKMTIPKNRGGTPVLEKTTIKFDSDVWVDETRRI